MATDRKAGIVIQERDRHLFRELNLMRVIDREQATIIGSFGSASRTNRRLHQLTQAGLLRRFFLGANGAGRKALYALSRKAAQAFELPYRGMQRRKDEVLATDLFVQHQLAVNQVYCAVKYPNILPAGVAFERWIPFTTPLSDALRLIPDGYVEITTPTGVVAAFLEVDRGPETLKVWQEKVRKYVALANSGQFEPAFHQSRFRVLVVATSERRMHSIRKTVAAMTDKVFWFATLDSLPNSGVFGSIWIRPKGEERQTLIQGLP
jgi:hypothetical protein